MGVVLQEYADGRVDAATWAQDLLVYSGFYLVREHEKFYDGRATENRMSSMFSCPLMTEEQKLISGSVPRGNLVNFKFPLDG